MFAYRLDELRFVVQASAASAVAATSLSLGVNVPLNKIWTILSAYYAPDMAETRTVQWWKLANTIPIAIQKPQTVALSATITWPLLESGDQMILLPGETLRVTRDVATAGSTMGMRVQYIESDLETMKYFDPQKLLSRDRRSRGFARTSILGATRSVLGSHEGEGGGPGGGEGEGGAIPV